MRIHAVLLSHNLDENITRIFFLTQIFFQTQGCLIYAGMQITRLNKVSLIVGSVLVNKAKNERNLLSPFVKHVNF